MANAEHLARLQQGTTAWNQWRLENLSLVPDLSKSNLSGANLKNAIVRRANFEETDLRGADLSGADLARAYLSRADLSNANIQTADLRETDIREAHLGGADLSRADLSGANLSRADLSGANLSHARLRKAKLEEAYLRSANLSSAVLPDANLSDADLCGSMLREANLQGANLDGAGLRGADLNAANLSGASLRGAALVWANPFLRGGDVEAFRNADLSDADLSSVNLSGFYLGGAKLRKANLSGANLSKAILEEADLRGANLTEADLNSADLSRADLTGASLVGTSFLHAKFKGANLSGCSVYGISAWDVTLDGAIQSNLRITPDDRPSPQVDDLELAQFLYLILDRKKVRNVLDALTSKAVLLLGRFTPERKAILDGLAEELRKQKLLPIIFDFERSTNLTFTDTIKILAGLSLFVIVDITKPRSAPQELMATVPDYQVPFVPILEEGEDPYSMFVDFQSYDWVLKPVVTYPSKEALVANFGSVILERAWAKHLELQRRKNETLQTMSLKEMIAQRPLAT